MSQSRVSIIVPMLNEAAGIAGALHRLRGLGAEIIAVDGGSSDASLALAMPLADRAFSASCGRARQMNAGAAAANGDILLFLHADTALPPEALDLIEAAITAGHRWGRFDIRIAGVSPLFPLIAALMNLRSRLSGIATGDQAIFVSRSAFVEAGGYADISLMEDIALSKALRRQGPPACLRARVETSGRRWEQHGVLRTIVFMWWLRLRYWLGAKPRRLAQEYGYEPPE